MTYLSLVLIVKIGITLLGAVVPFLFGPSSLAASVLSMERPPALLQRLYGVAILALLVGYGFGIPAAEAGKVPWGVLSMGLVSNAGAAFLLATLGRGPMPKLGAALFGAIAAALAACLLLPEIAITPAF